MKSEESPYRLPKHVVPYHYDLVFKTDFTTFKFKGSETVNVKVEEATSCMKLNSLALDIYSVEYISGDETVAAEWCLDEKFQTVTFTFSKQLQPGEGKLKIEYTGTNEDNLEGFYRAKYVTSSGEERYSLITQFETSGARRTFPCWDEPAFKATFAVTVQAPKDRTILSNMPVIEEDEVGDEVIVKFDKTPIMSTYLLAMAVGEYSYVETFTKSGVKVRTYTPKDKQEYGKFANDWAAKLLDYYEDYFAIPYPLPKCDLIAAINLANAAMENWGLVTCRESYLLVEPNSKAAKHKETIASMIAHELAHMWFGNLVTMEWWTDLWLNEGYASFAETLSVDHLCPEYKICNQFIGDHLLSALKLDALKNSHPIEVPVESAEEVDEIFDLISYNKGNSIIRMLHNYLGEQDFQKGMRLYLNRHAYKNCCTADLWSALEEATGKPVGKMMSSWTLQTGFPVVTVSQGRDCLKLKQKRFMADGSEDDGSVLWVIPIRVMTSRGTHFDVVMESQSMEVNLEDDGSDWIKLNPSWYGVYRTCYSNEMLEAFIPAIKNKSLPSLDRLSVIDDVFALVFSGGYDTVKALQLLDAYKDEDDYTVWTSLTASLARLTSLLEYTNYFDKYLDFIKNFMSNILEKVGFYGNKDEDHLATLLRSMIIGILSVCKHEGVISEMRVMFDDHFSGKKQIDDDMRAVVYSSVMRHGDEKAMQQLRKLYDLTDMSEEQYRLAQGMSKTCDPSLLLKHFDFCMSDKVRSQDCVFVISSSTNTKMGRELAWTYFKDHREDFNKKFGSTGDYLVSRMISYIIEKNVCLDKAKEMEEYFEAFPYPTSERLLKQALESVRVNANWFQTQPQPVGNYINQL